MKTVIHTSVKMPPSLHARVANLAEIRQRTAHTLMLQAIETFLDREEKREALRQEAKAASDHYEQTGLHLTNAEVVGWMEKIIEGEKVSMPKCHI